MEQAWKDIGQHISLEVPKGDVVSDATEQTVTFLGCQQTRSEKVIKGQKVQCIEYDISKQLKRALTKYEEAVYAATGLVPEYIKAKTPFMEEDSRCSPHREPYVDEDFYECPSCAHTVRKSSIDLSLIHI